MTILGGCQRGVGAAVLLAGVLTFSVTPAGAFPGETTRVSVDSAGNEGNNFSIGSSISANGRFVAFGSFASNLVPGGTNVENGFVHDRKTGITTLVSVDSAGNEGNDASFGGSISANGRFVAFGSFASNLVPGDTNEIDDVFVHDRKTASPHE
jgi:hypothetical protein